MSRNKNRMVFPAPEDERESWEPVLEDYLAFLHGSGRSENTVALYRDQISRFYRSCAPRWDEERAAFLMWNGETHIHSNHRLDSCRRFWDWGIRELRRKTNPAENIPRRLTDKNRIPNVSLSDIEKLLDVFREEQRAHPNKWERIRNYAYILFAIGTGVRPGEGLRARRCDFNLSEYQVIIRGEHVKTRQSRVVYIPQNKVLTKLLRKLVRIQAKSDLPAESPLFSDSGGKALNTRSWFHIVDQRAKKAGIRIKPYDLRHAFITHSLINGANPYDLRDQVGHSNMEMMKRYFHSNAEARRNTANLAPLQNIAL